MPNMDGTGPRAVGQGTGFGRRQCRCGRGEGWGRRRGRGPCRLAADAEKQELLDRREALHAELDAVEQQLKED